MAPGRSSKWPSNAEIRERASAAWTSEAPSESFATDNPPPLSVDIPSDIADDGQRKLGQFNNNDAEHNLADWSGDWAPPPIEWDIRPQFQDHDLAESIQQWMSKIDREATGSAAGKFKTPREQLLGLDDDAPVEICPSEWSPDHVEEYDIMTWLFRHMKFISLPKFEDLVDTDVNMKPYWMRYWGRERERLEEIRFPDAPPDPAEPVSPKRSKQTSMRSAEEHVERFKRRQDRTRAAKKDRRRFNQDNANFVPQVTAHTPLVNMFIRSAEPRDLVQITALINRNIQTQVDMPEMQPLPQEVWADRLVENQAVGLPFLVAVERHERQPNGPPRPSAARDFIIGCTFADEYSDRSDMLRYAVEIECFVHEDYMRKKVGSALLDKLLCILDPVWPGFGGYDYIGPSSGNVRVVKNIMVHFYVDSEDADKFNWCSSWLKRFGFDKRGDIPGVGRKLEK